MGDATTNVSDIVFFLPIGETSPHAILANGYHVVFTDMEQTYYSVEQYMMYKKASLFPENEEIMTEILKTTEYESIKSLGRRVKNFDGAIWDRVAKKIVNTGCTLKFEQNSDLTSHLLSTGDLVLAQVSQDSKWSIGSNVPVSTWSGENLCGEILKDIRCEFWRNMLL